MALNRISMSSNYEDDI